MTSPIRVPAASRVPSPVPGLKSRGTYCGRVSFVARSDTPAESRRSRGSDCDGRVERLTNLPGRPVVDQNADHEGLGARVGRVGLLIRHAVWIPTGCVNGGLVTGGQGAVDDWFGGVTPG